MLRETQSDTVVNYTIPARTSFAGTGSHIINLFRAVVQQQQLGVSVWVLIVLIPSESQLCRLSSSILADIISILSTGWIHTHTYD